MIRANGASVTTYDQAASVPKGRCLLAVGHLVSLAPAGERGGLDAVVLDEGGERRVDDVLVDARGLGDLRRGHTRAVTDHLENGVTVRPPRLAYSRALRLRAVGRAGHALGGRARLHGLQGGEGVGEPLVFISEHRQFPDTTLQLLDRRVEEVWHETSCEALSGDRQGHCT